MRACLALVLLSTIGCLGETFQPSDTGGTGGGSGGGTGTAGAGAGTGGVTKYGQAVCGVSTGIDVEISAPGCEPSDSSCVADWAGKFGEPGHVDGEASAARFAGIYGVAVGEANVFVTTAHAVRRIHIATGAVDTIAGSEEAGSADGVGKQASFDCPRGIALRAGNLFVADSGNSRIRRINVATREVTTLPADVTDPSHVLVREDGALYVSQPSEVRACTRHPRSRATARPATPSGSARARASSTPPTSCSTRRPPACSSRKAR